jgi:hypothetical protein
MHPDATGWLARVCRKCARDAPEMCQGGGAPLTFWIACHYRYTQFKRGANTSRSLSSPSRPRTHCHDVLRLGGSGGRGSNPRSRPIPEPNNTRPLSDPPGPSPDRPGGLQPYLVDPRGLPAWHPSLTAVRRGIPESVMATRKVNLVFDEDLIARARQQDLSEAGKSDVRVVEDALAVFLGLRASTNRARRGRWRPRTPTGSPSQRSGQFVGRAAQLDPCGRRPKRPGIRVHRQRQRGTRPTRAGVA